MENKDLILILKGLRAAIYDKSLAKEIDQRVEELSDKEQDTKK